jgi:hypothetical protein
LGYVGLFVDNVRGVHGGGYFPYPSGRGCLLDVRDLRLFYDGVCYFEVTHVVSGVSVGSRLLFTVMLGIR